MTPKRAEDLVVGQEASHSTVVTSPLIAQYAELVNDHAPVHFDEAFARSCGFDGRIAHGLLLASFFSGLLGEKLPGPHSVINTLSLKMHQPSRVGDALTFTVRVAHVSEGVGAVVLELEAKRSEGTVVLTGKASCSFPHPARE